MPLIISAHSIVDAAQKLGDAKDQLTAIIMHSATEAELKKRDLIEYIPASTNGTDRIPTFLGKRVIVDDGTPVDTENGCTRHICSVRALWLMAKATRSASFRRKRIVIAWLAKIILSTVVRLSCIPVGYGSHLQTSLAYRLPTLSWQTETTGHECMNQRPSVL